MPKNGIFIGRFQPFHKGHQAVIEKIMNDGLKPIVIVGSVNSTDNSRNPYSFDQVKKMITSVFPDIVCLPLPDYQDDMKWLSHLRSIIPCESVIYYFRKDEDLKNGVHYLDFLDGKIELREINSDEINIPVRATQIRSNYERFKLFLPSSVYQIMINCDKHKLAEMKK